MIAFADSPDGRVVHVAMDGGTAALLGELHRCHTAYGVPLMVTESAVEGDSAKQCAWLDQLVAALQHLRGEAFPIVGLTWWPLVDFVDWSWASGGSVVEEFYQRDVDGQPPHPVLPPGGAGGSILPFLRRMGIYRLEPDTAGSLARRPTRLLEHFRAHATRPAAEQARAAK